MFFEENPMLPEAVRRNAMRRDDAIAFANIAIIPLYGRMSVKNTIREACIPMRFEPNPKHTEPWQRGRKGSLCPPKGELSLLTAARLLRTSELEKDKRYNCYEGKAYCARKHGEDTWHGYPVSLKDVPPRLTKKWRAEGRVSRRDIGRAP